MLLTCDVETATTPQQNTRDEAKRKRLLGAYFTPDALTKVICEWAIRSPKEQVLEPSFGGCGFLGAAEHRLKSLGAKSPAKNLYGCDIDPSAFEYLSDRFGENAGKNFLLSDFLEIRQPPSWPTQFDVLVGNPPYVSYHNLTQEQRLMATQAIAESPSTISLGRHASLWAYFLLLSLHYVKAGGRLAFVLPRSFLDASYAKDLREYVASYFDRCMVFVMEPQLFMQEGTEERTLCLLAEGRRSDPAKNQIMIASASSVAELPGLINGWRDGSVVDTPIPERAMFALMDKQIKSDFEALAVLADCKRIGDLCRIKIGMVTGANPFFLFSKKRAQEHTLNPRYFKPIVSRFSDLRGLTFTEDDHALNKNADLTCFVLSPNEIGVEGGAIKKYLDTFPAIERASNKTFKKRKQWYRPVDGDIPHAFLSCMLDVGPRICLNNSDSNCTNTIHRGYFDPKLPEYKRKIIAISVLTTFSQLSAEIEGRSYGSGVLKLEPGEFARIQIFTPSDISVADANQGFTQVNALIREGKHEEARRFADKFIWSERGHLQSEIVNTRLHFELQRVRNLRRRPSRHI